MPQSRAAPTARVVVVAPDLSAENRHEAFGRRVAERDEGGAEALAGALLAAAGRVELLARDDAQLEQDLGDELVS